MKILLSYYHVFLNFSILDSLVCPVGCPTLCPDGCCTLANAYCCPDLKHCAPSPNKCSQSKSELVKKKLLSVGKYNCNGTDEIQCPGGCCHGGPNWPNWPNWHCCRYGAFCAPYAEDCIIAKILKSVKKKLLSVVKSNCDGPDETQCSGGCCHEGPNWHCCPDGRYCAAEAEDCQISRGPYPDDCKYHGYQNVDPSAQCYCERKWGTGYCFDTFENCCIS